MSLYLLIQLPVITRSIEQITKPSCLRNTIQMPDLIDTKQVLATVEIFTENRAYLRDVEQRVVCQIDDAEDAQIVSVLLDPPIPDGFDVCNTEIVPGVPNLAYNLQVRLSY